MSGTTMSRARLAAAAGALALVAGGLLISQSSASLTIDIRATAYQAFGGSYVGINNGGGTDGVPLAYGAGASSYNPGGMGVGDTFLLGVFVTVTSASNSVDNTSQADDYQKFQSVWGSITQSSFLSTSGSFTLYPSYNGISAAGGMDYGAGNGVFGDLGAQGGAIQDINSNGILDIGATSSTPSSSTNWIFARGSNQKSIDNKSGGIIFLNPSDHKTTEFFLGSVELTITNFTAGGGLNLQWTLPPNGFANAPGTWTEDGVVKSTTGSTVGMFVTSGVTLGTAVPEPTTFAMLIGGIGMLVGFRRRRS